MGCDFVHRRALDEIGGVCREVEVLDGKGRRKECVSEMISERRVVQQDCDRTIDSL